MKMCLLEYYMITQVKLKLRFSYKCMLKIAHILVLSCALNLPVGFHVTFMYG